MATESRQAQVSAMSAEAERASAGGGSRRRVPTGSLQPPRRGQIMERIIKDVVSAVSNIGYIAAGLVRADKKGAGAGGQLAVADNADEK